MLNDSYKYFTFGRHISSFVSMITYVLLVLFYIRKPYLFFHIYNDLSIPFLVVMYMLLHVNEITSDTHKHFIFGRCNGSSYLWSLSLFGRHISFSLFMQIKLETVHTCVCIQNTNHFEVFSSSLNYLHL